MNLLNTFLNFNLFYLTVVIFFVNFVHMNVQNFGYMILFSFYLNMLHQFLLLRFTLPNLNKIVQCTAP